MKKQIFSAGVSFLAVSFLVSCERQAPGFSIAGGKSLAALTGGGGQPLIASSGLGSASAVPAPQNAAGGPVITIKPQMPRAEFDGTPLPSSNPPPNLDKSTQPVIDAVVPAGVSLLSAGKPVTGSDDNPSGATYSVVTDGEKNGADGYFVDMAPGKHWVQIDLGEQKEVWLLWVWHSHKQGYIYNDVLGMISDDPEFRTTVTVFNNDHDNSSGFGAGTDLCYVETNNGRRIPVSGVKGRYVRFYSRGRDLDDTNQYTEIEVYGK